MNGQLWSTDFDGTLYEGPRSEAVVPTEIINCIAMWLAANGSFHVLTGGSMAGLVRDRFDLVGEVYAELLRCGVSDAERRVRSRMSFSTSNGMEHYGVLDPRAEFGAEQISFERASSQWVSRDEACAFKEMVSTLFGMSTLAIDNPVGDHPDHVVALFLKRTTQTANCGQEEAAAMNAELSARGACMHLVFVRETETSAGVVQRFDAFPRVSGDLSKCHAARRVFPGFSRVIYTGDQPLGNDRSVFEWMEAQPGMESYAVKGPSQVVEVIGNL